VICAALWPDPIDPLCPQEFRDKACQIINEFARKAVTNRSLGESCANEVWVKWQALVKGGGLDSRKEAHWSILRFALLDFIADFANWDNSVIKDYLDTSRALTQSAHEVLAGVPGTRPLVVDPFAGGGSIPLEALRVGADAFASDLNPVAVLLNRVVLEHVPKFGSDLATEARRWGRWIGEQAELELARLYPADPDGARPIAYLWSRTVKCEGPACGTVIPLIRSLWLGKKPNNKWTIRLSPSTAGKRVDVSIERDACAVGNGTIRKGAVTCPVCNYTMPVEKIRKQLAAKHGGTEDARLMCVVTTRIDHRGRFYREPCERDLNALENVCDRIKALEEELPDEELPAVGTLGFRIQPYGFTHWRDLFSPRQRIALATLCRLVRQVGGHLRKERSEEFTLAVQEVLALAVGKMADYGSSFCTWMPQASQETVAHTFSRQAMPMVWDFAEAYPFAESSGGWLHGLEFSLMPIEAEARAALPIGTVNASSATHHPLPNDSGTAVVTDPPYYDAVPYADLSDYFLVWLRRCLLGTNSPMAAYRLSPKDEECVAHDSKGRGRMFFEMTMKSALSEARRVIKPEGIAVVVFAHKSTQGWETQLQAMVSAGWVVTGSWPIDTERGARLRAMDSAALASSVHLVCRPRENADGSVTDEVGDWRGVLAELPQRIRHWMPHLADEGVVGADAIFACLGPALEIFSRYSRVEKADGSEVFLAEYLEHVWAAVANEALTMIFAGADATGFEEDARLTAMWLWTLKTADANGADIASTEEDSGDDEERSGKKASAAGFVLEYDAARKIAQGLGAHLESLNHLVAISADQARLLPVSERMHHLFTKDEPEPHQANRKKKTAQMGMFEELAQSVFSQSGGSEAAVKRIGETTLDRIHQSMILFAAGRGEALKRFLGEDGVGRDGRFWRLAQALSALYPSSSEEKRWIDGVLARKKQLGF
jgi:adenine-specific DNA methylase